MATLPSKPPARIPLPSRIDRSSFFGSSHPVKLENGRSLKIESPIAVDSSLHGSFDPASGFASSSNTGLASTTWSSTATMPLNTTSHLDKRASGSGSPAIDENMFARSGISDSEHGPHHNFEDTSESISTSLKRGRSSKKRSIARGSDSSRSRPSSTIDVDSPGPPDLGQTGFVSSGDGYTAGKTKSASAGPSSNGMKASVVDLTKDDEEDDEVRNLITNTGSPNTRENHTRTPSFPELLASSSGSDLMSMIPVPPWMRYKSAKNKLGPSEVAKQTMINVDADMSSVADAGTGSGTRLDIRYTPPLSGPPLLLAQSDAHQHRITTFPKVKEEPVETHLISASFPTPISTDPTPTPAPSLNGTGTSEVEIIATRQVGNGRKRKRLGEDVDGDVDSGIDGGTVTAPVRGSKSVKQELLDQSLATSESISAPARDSPVNKRRLGQLRRRERERAEKSGSGFVSGVLSIVKKEGGGDKDALTRATRGAAANSITNSAVAKDKNALATTSIPATKKPTSTPTTKEKKEKEKEKLARREKKETLFLTGSVSLASLAASAGVGVAMSVGETVKMGARTARTNSGAYGSSPLTATSGSGKEKDGSMKAKASTNAKKDGEKETGGSASASASPPKPQKPLSNFAIAQQKRRERERLEKAGLAPPTSAEPGTSASGAVDVDAGNEVEEVPESVSTPLPSGPTKRRGRTRPSVSGTISGAGTRRKKVKLEVEDEVADGRDKMDVDAPVDPESKTKAKEKATNTKEQEKGKPMEKANSKSKTNTLDEVSAQRKVIKLVIPPLGTARRQSGLSGTAPNGVASGSGSAPTTSAAASAAAAVAASLAASFSPVPGLATTSSTSTTGNAKTPSSTSSFIRSPAFGTNFPSASASGRSSGLSSSLPSFSSGSTVPASGLRGWSGTNVINTTSGTNGVATASAVPTSTFLTAETAFTVFNALLTKHLGPPANTNVDSPAPNQHPLPNVNLKQSPSLAIPLVPPLAALPAHTPPIPGLSSSLPALPPPPPPLTATRTSLILGTEANLPSDPAERLPKLEMRYHRLSDMYVQKDVIIQEKEELLLKKDKEIGEMKEAIGEMRKELGRLGKIVEDRDEVIRRYNAEVLLKDEEIARLKDEAKRFGTQS